MARPIEILLVEDSPSDRFLALEALKSAKIVNNVQSVDDGVEALEYVHQSGKYAHSSRPDLILLDLNLPRKSGREVLAELKADPDLRTIPVVILAGSGEAGEGPSAYPQHADSYVTKPIDPEQFSYLIGMFQDFWFPFLSLAEDKSKDSRQTGLSCRDGGGSVSPLAIRDISSNGSQLSSMLAFNGDHCLVITDAQNNPLWIDDAFTRMCGYNIEDLKERKAGILLPGPMTDHAADTRMRIAVAGGRSCTEEIVNYHKDGHPYWVRLMINPICSPDGLLHGFLVVEQEMRDKRVAR
jgi:two-component system, chemotaxis family, response regulator Rcp1